MQQSIPTRSEADPRFTWAITDMYESDEAWREELLRMRGLSEKLASYQGRLCESAAALLEYLRLVDDVDRGAGKLVSYAFRRTDEDTRNPVYQEMSAQAQNYLVDLKKATDSLPFKLPFGGK